MVTGMSTLAELINIDDPGIPKIREREGVPGLHGKFKQPQAPKQRETATVAAQQAAVLVIAE